MTIKKIIIFLLFSLCLFYASDYEYEAYLSWATRGAATEFNADVTFGLNTGVTENNKICAGNEYNPNAFIRKAITYENMYILSHCDSIVQGEGSGTWKCGTGYDLYVSGLSSGVAKISSLNEKNEIIGTWPTKEKLGSSLVTSLINSYLSMNNGWARLSKFPTQTTPVNVDAKGKVGVGCLGNYNYVLEQEIFYINPITKVGGYTWKIVDEYSGTLDGNGKDYYFEEEGRYRVRYSSSINDCFVLYRERYLNSETNSYIQLVHLFKDEIKVSTQTGSRTLILIAESSQGPDYNVYGEGATCGIYGTPVQLTKGETVNVVTFVKIINDNSVPITVSEMNANYFIPGLFFPQPTGDIEIGSITTNIKLPLTIQPGSERTIRVTIPSKIKDSVTNPLDSYNLRVAFDYYYSDHPQKCYLGKSSVGLCNELITVSVVDDPPILYSLNANVDYVENGINREFIENEKKTVTIFGRVNLTTNDGKVPPTTQWIGGADVELVSLQIPGIGFDCLKTKGLKTTTAKLNAPPYSYTGNYRFDDVELNDVCLEYGITDILVAGIKVDYTTDDGTALTTSSHGQIPVNTALGVLTCDLNYKLTSSNYRPGEGEEEYLITITVENQYQDPEVIEYKCGNEEGEDWKTTTEDEFECAYEFDSVNPEDVIYIAQARVKDNIMEGREAVCNANIGLCLPYV